MTTMLAEPRTALDWMGGFQGWLRGLGRSENTVAAYGQDMQAWADWFEQATGYAFQPELLNSFDLARFRQWCLEVRKISPATWNRRLATLMVFCKWSRRKLGLSMPEDLFEGVVKAEEQQNAPDWLTDGEFERVGRYVESTALDPYETRTAARQVRAMRDRALAAAMVYAGLREMEVADLTWETVKLGERSGSITVLRGKGSKKRVVPVSGALLRILRRWCGRVLSEYVFPNETGGRLNERTIQERVHELGTKAGVEDLRPHRLRHTFAKRMADAGVGLEKIAELMGHENINVTRIYTKPGLEDLQEAVEKVALGKMAKRSANA